MSETPTPIPAPDDPAPVLPGDPAPEEGPVAERRFTAEVDGRRLEVRLRYPAATAPAGGAPAKPRAKREKKAAAAATASGDHVVTPMQGTVLKVLVEVGQAVEPGQVVCIVEAMKMENEVASPRAGTIRALHVEEGSAVTAGTVLADLD